MKILIIQLARLGDILLTWPQIRALKKEYPSAQIDILVRPKFKMATQCLKEINKIIEFPIESVFEPLFQEPLRIEQSLGILNKIIEELKSEDYQWIINSTLSPASSYLLSEIKSDKTKVTGYSRTSDGFLSIHDDVSSYMYAQMGIERNNRIHLGDLFVLMVGIQPNLDFWHTEVSEASPTLLTQYVVLHVGASREDKKYSPFKWRTFITHFQKMSDLPVLLIGTKDESNDAQFIALGFETNKVHDLTGKLEFQNLFPLIKNAKLYIGCDSAPLHIASLVGTPSLNISFSSVNFWETGPKSLKSRVLYAETEADLPSEKVALEAISILDGTPVKTDTIYTINDIPSFHAPIDTHGLDWTWNLIKSIYMNGEKPQFEHSTRKQGLKNLFDVNSVIMEQLEVIKRTGKVTLVSAIIERCEEVIETVGQLVPELCPLIRWYQTQKSNIGPKTPTLVLEETFNVHRDFGQILEYWLTDSIIKEIPNETVSITVNQNNPISTKGESHEPTQS